MLVTRAPTAGLVAGKLAASLVYVLFLLAASLPAFAIIYLFGGIAPWSVALVLAVAGATAVAHASLGLVLSALLRRTMFATVIAYLIVAGLLFGLPIAGSVASANRTPFDGGRTVSGSFSWGAYSPMSPGMSISWDGSSPFGMPSGPPPRYTYASPIVAVASAIPSGAVVGPGVSLLDFGLALLSGGAAPLGQNGLLRVTYVSLPDAMTGEPVVHEVWAPWVYYLGGSLATVPLAVLLAAAVLRSPARLVPRRRRQEGGAR
jgi:hypothetical protein